MSAAASKFLALYIVKIGDNFSRLNGSFQSTFGLSQSRILESSGISKPANFAISLAGCPTILG